MSLFLSLSLFSFPFFFFSFLHPGTVPTNTILTQSQTTQAVYTIHYKTTSSSVGPSLTHLIIVPGAFTGTLTFSSDPSDEQMRVDNLTGVEQVCRLVLFAPFNFHAFFVFFTFVFFLLLSASFFGSYCALPFSTCSVPVTKSSFLFHFSKYHP